MSRFARPQIWTRQPTYPIGINWNNPHTQGLVGLFSDHGQQRLVDYINGGQPTSDGSTARTGILGKSRAYSNTSSIYGNVSRYTLTNGTGLTVVALLDVDSLTNYGGLIACQTTTTTAGWELRLGSAATDSKINLLLANTSYTNWGTSANVITAGTKANFLAVSKTQIDLVNGSGFVNSNGVQSTLNRISGSGTGAMTASTGNLYIAKRYDGSTYLTGALYLVGVWNRPLSFAETESLRKNPWQLFQAPKRRNVVNISGGGTSVALSGVSTTGSIGSLGVTVDKALTGTLATGALGTVSPAVDKSLTGQSLTGSIGTLGVSVGTALTGVSATGSVGTLTPVSGVELALTGVSATGALGSLGVNINIPLIGISATGSIGTISANNQIDAVGESLLGYIDTRGFGTTGLIDTTGYGVSGGIIYSSYGVLGTIDLYGWGLKGTIDTTGYGVEGLI